MLEGFASHHLITEENEFSHRDVKMISIGDMVNGGVGEILGGLRDVSHAVVGLAKGLTGKPLGNKTSKNHVSD